MTRKHHNALVDALMGGASVGEGVDADRPALTWGPAPAGHDGGPAVPHGIGAGGSTAAGVQKTWDLAPGGPGQYSLGDRLADMIGISPRQQVRAIQATPANPNTNRPGMGTAEDMVRSGVTGAQRGLTGLAGTGGNARHLASQLFALGTVPFGADFGEATKFGERVTGETPVVGQLPDSTPFDVKMQGTTGEYHHPQTSQGRLSERVASMWPALVGSPGGVVPKVASMAIPGTASWAASEVAPEPYKGVAGVAGGAAGSALAGALFGRSPPETKMLADKTPPMSPAQQEAVVAALERGRDMGMQPTLTEGIDATVPGARTTMLQQYAEGTPEGIDTLGPRMAARPAQMQNIVRNIADQLAPETSPTDLEIGARNAAEGAIGATRRGVNAPAQPFYDALRGEEAAPGAVVRLMENPSFKVALQELRSDPILGPRFANLPDTNLSVINEAIKLANDMQTRLTPAPGNPYGNATRSAAVGSDIGSVNGVMRGLSDNWARARDIVSQGRQSQLTPMQEGPLGDIAGRPGQPAPDLGSMTNRLFPPTPPEGQPQVTADALAAMDYQNPGVGGQMVRNYLQQNAAESGQLIAGKPNTFAPSNFATRIGGNPLQRENVVGAATDINPQAGGALADALENFDVTGRRQAVGSNTVDKNAVSAAAESGGRVANAVLGGGSKRLIMDRLTGWWDDLKIANNRGALVDAVNANPQRAAEILSQIEGARGNTAVQRSLFNALLSGAGSAPTRDQGR